MNKSVAEMLTVNLVYYEGSKIQPIHISLDNIGAYEDIFCHHCMVQ